MDQGVGKVVKRLREERGWSQMRLAVEADMSVSGVSLIENGHRNLSTATLAKLAKALDVEIADLFPKVSAPLPWFDSTEARRSTIDVVALDKDLADELRREREFRLEELAVKLGRAEAEQERTAAFRDFKNWWILFVARTGIEHKYIPDIPGPELFREGDITVERVREFARRGGVSETQRADEIQSLEEALEGAPQEAHKERQT